MRRPPAGAKAFYAMGQSDSARGFWRRYRAWPAWACHAYNLGFLHQHPLKAKP